MKKNKIIISMFFNVIISIIIFFFIHSQNNKTNTLIKSKNWFSKKTSVYTYVSGADEFLNNPNTISDGKIDLTSWFGYNQIITQKEQKIDEVKIKAKFGENAYFGIVFDANNKPSLKQKGVRISAHKNKESLFFQSNDKGKFIKKEKIKQPDIKPKTWHEISLKLKKDKTILYIDGKKFAQSKNIVSNNLNKKVGVFSGAGTPGYNHNYVYVDYVNMYHQNKLVFSDNFNSIKKPIIVFIFIFISVNLAFWLISYIFFRKKEKRALYTTVFQITVTAILLISFLSNKYLDNFSLYNLFNKGKVKWSKETKNNEKTNIFNEEFYKIYTDILVPQLKGKDIKDIKCCQFSKPVYINSNEKKQTNKPIFKIMLIGSSQTYGSGAFKSDDLFSNQYEKQLNKNNNHDISYQVFNVGVPGSNIKDMHFLIKEKKLYKNFDLLILNMGSNDYNSSQKEVKKGFLDFIELAKNNNKHIFFSLEPTNQEALIFPNSIRPHAIMKDIAKKEKIFFVETQNKLYQMRNSGFLWWDMIHMTPYGQELFAKFLYEQTIDEIEKLARGE